jgi:hypothetical protein
MITGNPHSALKMKFYEDVTEGVKIIREFLSEIICE